MKINKKSGILPPNLYICTQCPQNSAFDYPKYAEFHTDFKSEEKSAPRKSYLPKNFAS